jgi:hypothetical protein
MGGTNEIRIHGFRAHVSVGEVHLHDDDGRKYQRDFRGFKEDLTEASQALKNSDGALEITGATDVSLIVGRHGSKTFAALTTSSDAPDDLLRWSEGC